MDLVNGARTAGFSKDAGYQSGSQTDALSQGDGFSLPQQPAESLNSLIQQQIIPRLLLIHSTESKRPSFFQGRRVRPDEVRDFAALPLTLEADQLLAEIDRLAAKGVSTESILVDLLAVSARRLGEMWEDDTCDFVDVTVGLWRLHEVMRECTMRGGQPFESQRGTQSALFSPMPGEQHNFGTMMVEEVFANAGWQTEVLFEPQRHELIHLLAERPFDLVALTVSCDCPSAVISDLITAMRSVSKNPKVRVIIGGSLINANPSLALGVGADGTAEDARSALVLAERIVAGIAPAASSMP
ncbi:MAG: cobalamin B12-binding domain-containing protein [Erythrobacter sp.]